MRCKNCGWPNEPNATRCVKCNAPLSTGSAMPETDRQPSYGGSQPSEHLNATLRESDASDSVNMRPDTSGAQGMSMGSDASRSSHLDPQRSADPSTCPKCGYKRSANVKVCPVCGTRFDKTFIDHGSQASQSSHASQPSHASQGGSRLGTINPWMVPTDESAFCTLQRIPWQNEKVEYEPVSYSGQEIILNRANTDSNNNSITSRTQAILTQENGRWFIEDGSEMHTTLIRVNRKVELQDGDVIVLGNRMFEFKKG